MLYFNKKTLLAKLETTYGVDSEPTGAANAMVATNITISPMEGQDVSRNLDQPFHGGQETIPVDLHCKMTFRIELQGSGTAGTAPAWAPVARMLGLAMTTVADTSVTFNPISADYESGTIYLQKDRIRYALLGVRGTGKAVFPASGIPYLECEVTGLFTQPTDQASLPAVTLTGFQAPQVVTAANTGTFTVNSVPLKMRNFEMDLRNEVAPRFLVNGDEIIIAGREEMVSMTVVQTLLSTFNPFALAAARTRIPVVLQHGATAGRRVALNIPSMQLMRPGGLSEANKIIEMQLTGTPLSPSGAGNDQFTLVLT